MYVISERKISIVWLCCASVLSEFLWTMVLSYVKSEYVPHFVCVFSVRVMEAIDDKD